MNKMVIFAAAGFGVGALVGFAIGRYCLKKKLVKQADDRVQNAVDLYNEYLEEAYSAMDEEFDQEQEINPVVVKEEEEEVKEEKPVKAIEMMRKEQWDTDFPEDDYDRQELWFFPEDDCVLTDEDGNILEPKEKYIGNIFDKIGFTTNTDPEIYICNHQMSTHYLVHKEKDISRDSFFNY